MYNGSIAVLAAIGAMVAGTSAALGQAVLRPSVAMPADFRAGSACDEAKQFLREDGVSRAVVAMMTCAQAERTAVRRGWRKQQSDGSAVRVVIGAGRAAAQAGSGKTTSPVRSAHGGVDPLGQAVKNMSAVGGIRGNRVGNYIRGIGGRAVDLITKGSTPTRGASSSGGGRAIGRPAGRGVVAALPKVQPPARPAVATPARAESGVVKQTQVAPRRDARSRSQRTASFRTAEAAPGETQARSTGESAPGTSVPLGSVLGGGAGVRQPGFVTEPTHQSPGDVRTVYTAMSEWTQRLAVSGAILRLGTGVEALLQQLTDLAMQGRFAEGDALVASVGA